MIKGEVMDSVTLKPLSFISVGAIGSNLGTISNEQGRFILQIKNKQNCIGVSAIGYLAKTIFINTLNDTFISIKLSPHSIKLNDVVVVPDFENRILDKMILKYSNDSVKNRIAFQSYIRLYSSTFGTTYENMEAVYSTNASIKKMQQLQLENGRYGLVDSFKQKNLVFSSDFSKLILYLNLFNYETIQKANYPWFPLFIKKRNKFVDVKLEGYESLNNNQVAHISINPRSKYDEEFFTTHLWIDLHHFNLVKLSSTILTPTQSPIFLLNRSPIILNKLELIILFESFGDTSNTFPKYYSIKLNYSVPGKDTLQIQTAIQFINYEKLNRDKIVVKQNYDFDYEIIQNILYIPEWWDRNLKLEKTKKEYDLTETFNRLKYFENCFTTKIDTSNFLNKRYSICEYPPKKKFVLNNLADSTPNNIIDSFILLQNGVQVAGLYFDMVFLHACYENKFKYVCLPIFDYKNSWVKSEFKVSSEIETIFNLLNKLYFIYSKKIENDVNEIENPCDYRVEVEKTRKYYLTAIDNEKRLMIFEVWKENKYLHWENKLNAEITELGY